MSFGLLKVIIIERFSDFSYSRQQKKLGASVSIAIPYKSSANIQMAEGTIIEKYNADGSWEDATNDTPWGRPAAELEVKVITWI